MRTPESERIRLERVKANIEKMQIEERKGQYDYALDALRKSGNYIRAKDKKRKDGEALLHWLFRLHEEYEPSSERDQRVIDLRKKGFAPRPALLTQYQARRGETNRTRTTEFDRLIDSLIDDQIIEKQTLIGEKTKRSREGKQKPSTFYRIKPPPEGISDKEWRRHENRTVGDILNRVRLALVKEALLRLGVTDLDQEIREMVNSTGRGRKECTVALLHHKAGSDIDTVLGEINDRMIEIFGKRLIEIERMTTIAGMSGLFTNKDHVLNKSWGGDLLPEYSDH